MMDNQVLETYNAIQEAIEEREALLRVVRAAEICCLRLKDEPMNGGAAGMVYGLMQALEALPEHLKTVDKR